MSIKTRKIGDILIVEPELNRLDVQSVPAFKKSVADLSLPERHLIVDLHTVQFIDSTGLGALLSLLRRVKEVDGQLVLSDVSDQALAMFRLVKMTRIFDIYETVEDALEALND